MVSFFVQFGDVVISVLFLSFVTSIPVTFLFRTFFVVSPFRQRRYFGDFFSSFVSSISVTSLFHTFFQSLAHFNSGFMLVLLEYRYWRQNPLLFKSNINPHDRLGVVQKRSLMTSRDEVHILGQDAIINQQSYPFNYLKF